MNKQELLDQVKADIVKNNVCPHLAQNAKNLVFGVGSPDADILFIGEAPGKNEDEQGEPFVGAAGKFLDEMLADNKLSRSQIYITNIVKYRPPNNRDPEPEEKKEFWPYLIKQINIIQPKVVVTLGRHSMVMFLTEQKISQIHGQPKRIKWNYDMDVKLSGGKRRDAMQGAGNPSKTQMTTYLDEAQESAEKRSEAYDRYVEASIAGDDLAIRQEGLRQGELGSAAGNPGTLVILPLYHPAAALYNGGMRETLKEDFKNIITTINLIRKGN